MTKLGNGSKGQGAGVPTYGRRFHQALGGWKVPWLGSDRICSGFILTVYLIVIKKQKKGLMSVTVPLRIHLCPKNLP